MYGLAITDKGLEEIAQKEIFEKIKSKGKIEDSIVIFPITKEEELCKLAYTCQSVRRIILLVKEIKINKNLDENIVSLSKELFGKELKKYSSKKINVECERSGEHNFNSVEFAKEVSQIIDKEGLNITREEYDLNLYIYIHDDKGYIGVDFSGRDLSKRNYRIFTKASTLKGTLGYALLRFAEYKPGEIILDPSCESGIIPIEAVTYAIKKPINFYNKEFSFQQINSDFSKIFASEDKKTKKNVKGIYAVDKQLSNIYSTKKNAKIAGVEKNITFSKIDIEWLDTKFEKETIDKIIVKLPSESKKISEKIIGKLYEEFFHQAEFILKKKGLLVICSLKDKQIIEFAKKKGFKIKNKKIMFSGQQEYCVNIMLKT